MINNYNTVNTMEQIQGADGKSFEKILRGREERFLVKSHIAGIVPNVQFNLSVVSDALWPHGLQHTRPPCPSPIPRVYSNSCPLSQWYHPTNLSSVVPFSSCLQSFPASGSFQISQFFASGGPKYWSFSFSISSFSEYSGLISFGIDWFDLLVVHGTLKSLL